MLTCMQMSELFNHRNSLTGKIPSGLFNSCFDLECGSWADEASATKCLAFDGYFISLLDLRLDCRPLALADHVVRDVPAAWDPSAIARYGRQFISLLSCYYHPDPDPDPGCSFLPSDIDMVRGLKLLFKKHALKLTYSKPNRVQAKLR